MKTLTLKYCARNSVNAVFTHWGQLRPFRTKWKDRFQALSLALHLMGAGVLCLGIKRTEREANNS
jgi:hypothetical protein